jgi:polysaccharide biosynthesis transport protein
MDSREKIDLDLSRYLLKLRRHWFRAASIYFMIVILALLSTLLLKPSYRAEGKLRFKVERTPYLTGIEEATGELRPLVSTQNPLSTEIEVIYAKPLLQKVINALSLTNSEGEMLLPEDLLQKLHVSIIGGTDVLQLAYESDQPKKAAEVVNTLIRFYIHDEIQNRRSKAVLAKQFIAEQLPQTERVVRQAEEALRQFKEKYKIVDLRAEGEAAVTKISQLDSEITTTQGVLDEAIARSRALRSQVGLSTQNAIAVSNLSQSSEVQEVLRELQGVERQLATAPEIYQDAFPTIVELKSKRKALKALLQRKSREILHSQSEAPTVRVEIGDPKQSPIKEFLAAEVQRRAMAKRVETLLSRRSTYQQRTQNLPKLGQNMRELERQLSAAQSTYETLLKKLQELKVEENTNSSNAQIIEQALVPTKAAFNKPKLIILAFGVLLGAFLATASIPLLETQRRSLKSPTEIKEKFGYPLWATIQHLEDQNFASDSYKTLLPFVDNMHQMVQMNPQLLYEDQALKTILVTSAESQEGKSTIAANLAAAMAQLGRRVLLIDANLSSPSLHHIFELPNKLGLSDAINDVSLRLDEVKMIVNFVNENLDVLVSGTLSTDPIRSLNSERMVLLLQYFSLNYDTVILDSMPLLHISGSSRLGDIVDGILLVTQLGVIDAESVVEVRRALAQSEKKVIGIVANGVTKNRSDLLIGPTLKHTF